MESEGGGIIQALLYHPELIIQIDTSPFVTVSANESERDIMNQIDEATGKLL